MAGDPEGYPEGYPEGDPVYETTGLSEKTPGDIVAGPDANTEPLGSCDCVEVPKRLLSRDGEVVKEEDPE